MNANTNTPKTESKAMKEAPPLGSEYWFGSPMQADGPHQWTGTHWDKLCLGAGRCYATEEDAHAILAAPQPEATSTEEEGDACGAEYAKIGWEPEHYVAYARGWHDRAQRAAQAPTAVQASATQAEPAYSGWIWTHKKRGGEYELLGDARLQADAPLTDMAEVYVYQGEDRRMWVRPVAEFNDRFKRVRVGRTALATAAVPCDASSVQPALTNDQWHALEEGACAVDELVSEGRWNAHAGDYAKVLRSMKGTPAAPGPAASSAVPQGYALVPLRLNRAMDRVLEEDDWRWEDLLAAAESITEEQYAESAAASSSAVPAEPTDDELSRVSQNYNTGRAGGDIDFARAVLSRWGAAASPALAPEQSND
jgi:hypothetical protein